MNDKIYIYPTDTVWGVGGSIYSKVAFDRVMQIKGIISPRPVSILLSSIEQMYDFINRGLSRRDIQFSNEQFLRDFFQLGSSLGVDLALLDISRIPRYIYQDSDFVSFRCLDARNVGKFSWVRRICEEVGAPIVTTSLNRTTDPPIVDYLQARSFQQKYAVDAILVDDHEAANFIPSGKASTIVRLDAVGAVHIIRQGEHLDELKKLFEKYFLL
ncbi:MAG: Sua5/YciO/YrdC/YwlC family protein [Oligoflexia bacterium]|nr:Sua5/YciO/YrdC/YwlC family protein [Oligoflexia bacterium]